MAGHTRAPDAAPTVSIALIRGRATGNGSEIALACDMSFASREKAVLSQWEVGVGLVAGGGPMARLPRLMGRGRALEVLLSSNDIRGDLAEAYGYVNRSLPDADLDELRRCARDPHRLVRQVGDREHEAPGQRRELTPRRRDRGRMGRLHGFDRSACRARGIKALFEQGFHRPGDAENRLGFYLGRLGR